MSATVGCCGFPVARARYFGTFRAVETASTFHQLPREVTADKWRAEAPADFVFALRAWQPLTHLATSPGFARLRPAMGRRELGLAGHFRQNDVVWGAWQKFERVAQILRPKFIVFETPTTFYPNADHLRDIYKFFKRLKRGSWQYVWEPRGPSWEDRHIERTCKDLGLIHAVDPLRREPLGGRVRYYRLHGMFDGRRWQHRHRFSDADLKAVAERCGGRESYVFFNNHAMWADAERCAGFADPVTAALRRAAARRPRRRS